MKKFYLQNFLAQNNQAQNTWRENIFDQKFNFEFLLNAKFKNLNSQEQQTMKIDNSKIAKPKLLYPTKC